MTFSKYVFLEPICSYSVVLIEPLFSAPCFFVTYIWLSFMFVILYDTSTVRRVGQCGQRMMVEVPACVCGARAAQG